MKLSPILATAGIVSFSFIPVANAQPGISVVSPAARYALTAESTSYDNETLTIPRISQPGEPIAYQNVVLEKTAQGDWRLKQASESQLISTIERVERVQADAFPVQVYLKVFGYLRNGCESIGDVVSDISGNQINLSMYLNALDTTSDELIACTQSVRSFYYVVPLPVYGLQAGEYQYRVNDGFTGSFTLEKDNVFEPESHSITQDGGPVACVVDDDGCVSDESTFSHQTINGDGYDN